jgi:IS30 family transposase
MQLNEALIIEQYGQERSTRDIAKEHGVTATTIRNVLKRNGVALRPRGGNNTKRKALDNALILRLYAEKMSVTAIAKQLGADKRRVMQVIVSAGQFRGYRKLDETIVAEVKTLRRRHKWTWAQLIERTSVSYTSLWFAVNGPEWKYVPEAEYVDVGEGMGVAHV